MALRDHQAYSKAEIERLLETLRRHKAECFVTTEKDAARMTHAQRARLEEAAPLRVARLEVSLEDEGAVVRQLLGLIVRK